MTEKKEKFLSSQEGTAWVKILIVLGGVIAIMAIVFFISFGRDNPWDKAFHPVDTKYKGRNLPDDYK